MMLSEATSRRPYERRVKLRKEAELDALFTLSALEPENDNRRLGVGAALDDLGRGSEALEEWFHAVRLRHATLQQQHTAANELRARTEAYHARIAARQRHKLVIAIFCDEYGQTWWPALGPSSLATNGLGWSGRRPSCSRGAREASVIPSRSTTSVLTTI